MDVTFSLAAQKLAWHDSVPTRVDAKCGDDQGGRDEEAVTEHNHQRRPNGM